MKKIMIATAVALCSIFQLVAQENKEILEIFEKQVKAFNKADVEELVNNVSEDFKYFYITSDELVLEVEGKEQFRKSMKSYFGRGVKVVSTILEYSISGNKISFKEEAGHNNEDGKFISAIALGTYEIKDGKITRSWYFID